MCVHKMLYTFIYIYAFVSRFELQRLFPSARSMPASLVTFDHVDVWSDVDVNDSVAVTKLKVTIKDWLQTIFGKTDPMVIVLEQEVNNIHIHAGLVVSSE